MKIIILFEIKRLRASSINLVFCNITNEQVFISIMLILKTIGNANIPNLKASRPKILGLFLLFTSFHPVASGNFFRPENYEECVSDGKVGRSNLELSAHKSMCRKKFPVLSKIANYGTGKIQCVDIHDKSTIAFNISKKSVNAVGSRLDFPISFNSREIIRFEGDSSEKESGKKVKMFGELNLLEGDMQLAVKYKDNPK